MTKVFKLCPLLLCLFCTMAQASPPSQSDFDFLKPLNNTVLVENGLVLTERIAGVSLSTLLNLGVWWAVCKTAGTVAGLSSAYDLAESDTKELEKLKTDFCMQLAPMITTAEVALAGHISPWPLDQRWWRPLYFAGAGMTVYATMTEAREHLPATVLTYLASEAVSRTGASAISVFNLRKMGLRGMATEWYLASEYTVFSAVNGIIVGTVVYEAMTHKGLRPAKAALASVVSAAIMGTFSGIASLFTINTDGQAKAEAGIEAGSIAQIGAIAGAGAAVGAAGATVSGVETGIATIAEAAAVATAIAAVAAIVATDSPGSLTAELGTLAGTIAGAFTSGVVTALLMYGNSKINSNNPFIKAIATLVPALTFAVINSFSNYAVYGCPLEEGLSETGWTQWKKFYAPLDYLSTLFN
ncbi:hypothetical protein [Endozoicomonas sp. 4G]|uniref:hypothetical protein n=1 Tax=Endozoicomonas sp. 4G TaxID=2872754 RepID=UPI002078DD94|nr:hypothetical protein [Endozoicomonas sp. 4G]